MNNWPAITTATTNVSFTGGIRLMIEEPAFICVNLVNGTAIRARAVAYDDPKSSTNYGAFSFRDREGTTTYVLWAAVVMLTVFPLVSPDAPVPPEIEAEPSA